MGSYVQSLGHRTYRFADLRELLAKASPERSGDQLAGLAAESAEQRVAAQMALAEVPLDRFLAEPLLPYERDEVTRLILDSHDRQAFQPLSGFTVGDLREWLLAYETTAAAVSAAAPGLTPEMAAAVSKLMRNQDLIAAARKCRVVTRFRNTIGLPGRLSSRLQPNHPTDDPKGIAASVLDGLLYGCGDAVIGVNPATDSPARTVTLLSLLDELRERFAIPAQTCVLAHVSTTLAAIEAGAPVDLVFQSIAGTEAANKSFGVSLALLEEARDAALSLGRGTVGHDVMYFETGQGSALSADAHGGVDQQTCEARAYAVARRFQPLLVNTVVGFIGPEYLFDGKQILRAGLEDHFCGKLLGLPMGCDVCYTNHAEADQDDADALLTLLGVAGCSYVMGVPGADDVMLGYQSTSFHDVLYLRDALGLRPAPEFEAWLEGMGILVGGTRLARTGGGNPLLRSAAGLVEGTGHDRSGAPGRPGGSPEDAAGGPRVAAPAAEHRGNSPMTVSDERKLPGSCGAGGDPAARTRAVPAEPVQPDPWHGLRRFTSARIALGRSGSGLPTRELLAFRLDHARARDAVRAPFDAAALAAELEAGGFDTVAVESAATTADTYLRRPDLGRRLAAPCRGPLERRRSARGWDAAFVLADGLSALAAHRHGPALLGLVAGRLAALGWSVAPIVVATRGRVALGDEIGQCLGAEQVAVLLGERPGLTAPDSLGVYLTYGPRLGRTDAERNCVSNIRPEGLSYDTAADTLVYLMVEARRRRVTGVALKDDRSGQDLLTGR